MPNRTGCGEKFPVWRIHGTAGLKEQAGKEELELLTVLMSEGGVDKWHKMYLF